MLTVELVKQILSEDPYLQRERETRSYRLVKRLGVKGIAKDSLIIRRAISKVLDYILQCKRGIQHVDTKVADTVIDEYGNSVYELIQCLIAREDESVKRLIPRPKKLPKSLNTEITYGYIRDFVILNEVLKYVRLFGKGMVNDLLQRSHYIRAVVSDYGILDSIGETSTIDTVIAVLNKSITDAFTNIKKQGLILPMVSESNVISRATGFKKYLTQFMEYTLYAKDKTIEDFYRYLQEVGASNLYLDALAKLPRDLRVYHLYVHNIGDSNTIALMWNTEDILKDIAQILSIFSEVYGELDGTEMEVTYHLTGDDSEAEYVLLEILEEEEKDEPRVYGFDPYASDQEVELALEQKSVKHKKARIIELDADGKKSPIIVNYGDLVVAL